MCEPIAQSAGAPTRRRPSWPTRRRSAELRMASIHLPGGPGTHGAFVISTTAATLHCASSQASPTRQDAQVRHEQPAPTRS